MINFDELRYDGNICVFIRHGEKDSANYSLTNQGRKDARDFALAIRCLNKKVVIYTSPEDRCVETANIICSTINDKDITVNYSNLLGKPGIQVKNDVKYIKLTDKMRCRDIYRDWKIGMYGEEMNKPDAIRVMIMDFLKKTSLSNGIAIYISQSGTVACSGYSLGLIDFKADDNDWVNYLDGFVLRL